ncbi:3-hydroxyacyl-CoA dehydrogenase/enoyl-CoA hydratase family protein [Mycoavidus sp. HKI]|uniref:3-hydroxyacyl-CoA dehydrogenase/enoyl-CoA hydratase family protein n=1 Tax=Mycoavidus sp. HKI TaxID=2840467 RepID=UPI001CC1582E|nr:3-hydroxyacyl-CoA dehydrogenase/enoyl-CoA hydratase family protein [Mycoavidus sp. HKI]UAW64411.1 3-hydroxyacyl-CoA dehydrogenase/enoyl-CoA hydratase family protein [Mycoavidus sp. HKI]
MSHLSIRKVAVLGAGVMGSQIAAHLINAKVPVILFDLPAQQGPKNSIAQKAIEHLRKLNPAPLGVSHDASYIEPANYEDDLAKLNECDLVIEAIAERIDWKHDLYKKVAPAIRHDAIFVSNTSGLSINTLAEGLDAELKFRFCGVHFFNPPRYMHLVELIPAQQTRAGILDGLESFLTSTLGKGVIRAKDTPNFIANRVGVFSVLATIKEAEKFELGFDLVDDLTGRRLGRAKSATFRTADVVGLDTVSHVIKTMRDNLLDDPFFPIYNEPPVLSALVAQGALGQKSGAGFYKKEGKLIKVLDAKQGAYIASGARADALVERILKRPPAERFKLLHESTHPQARFLWAIFRNVFHYSAVHLEHIADNARDLDFAVRWGFGWNEGPFESWQAAGWRQLAEWVQADIDAGAALSKAPLPAWALDGLVAEQGGVHNAAGSWSPKARTFVPRSALAVYTKQVFRAPLNGEVAADPRTAGKTLHENEAVRIWVDARAGQDDVAIVSFKSKMNTIGPAVLDGIVQAIELAEQNHRGLVVWQPSALQAGPFSAGANLEGLVPSLMAGGAKKVEPFVAQFQQTMQRVKYAAVPVVPAIAGIALGGGCELVMHGAKRVAYFESYIGLVEAGVGLLPAGGGLKEGALRAAETARCLGQRNLLEFLVKPFENIARAKVSSSALEAIEFGYLLPSDTIVFNLHELLATALSEARALANAGWRAPLPVHAIAVAGRAGIATIKAQLVNLRDGGFISVHDFLISSKIAEVLCGGEVEMGSLVDEAWLLKLERAAFVELLDMKKTQERIIGMLQTGKPVRN